MNDRPLNELIESANLLRSHLPQPELYEAILTSVQYYSNTWKSILSQAPLQILYSDWAEEKVVLQNCLLEIERELREEEMLIAGGENPSTVLARNKSLLEGHLPVDGKNSLDRLIQIQNKIHSANPQEGVAFGDDVKEGEDLLLNLVKKGEEISTALQNIPLKWKEYRDKYKQPL